MSQSQYLPFDDERLLLFEAAEQERVSARSLATVEALHLATLAVSATLACMVLFHDSGAFGASLALVVGFFALIALLLARGMGLVLSDFYRTMQYREKFFLLMLHVAVPFMLPFVIPMPHASFAWAVLLVVLAFESFDRHWAGRFLGLQLLLVMTAMIWGAHIPGWLIAIWQFCWLLSVRLGFVRFRLADHEHRGSARIYDVLSRSLVPSLLPALVAWVVYTLLAPHWEPRQWQFDIVPPSQRNPSATEVSMSRVFWSGLAMVVVIIGAIALLQWLEGKLRRKGSATPEVDADLGASEREVRLTTRDGLPLVVDPPSGARARVLAAFAALAKHLEKLGTARQPGETAPEYLARVAKESATDEAPSPRIFDEACYSEQPITEPMAGEFEAAMAALMESPRQVGDEAKPE